MLKEKIASLGKNTVLSLRRFPVTAMFIVLAAADCIVMIFGNSGRIPFDILATAGFGAAVFLLCELWQETRKESGKSSLVSALVTYVLAGALTVGAFVLLFLQISPDYISLGMIGMAGACVVGSVLLLTRGDENLCATAILIRTAILVFVLWGVVWSGMAGSYAAFLELVLDRMDTAHGVLTILTLSGMLAAFVFLAGIPKSGEKRVLGKAYKVVFVYAELPVFLLLLGVLYVYLIKIVISLHLPNGGVNSYALTADFLYLFNLFAVSAFAAEQPLARFFRRFGGLLMIPVLVMQGIAVGVRLYHYGLTVPRVFVLYVMAVTLAFALGSFFKALGISKALVFTAVLAMILTVTPLNMINLPLWQQSASLKHILSRNGMFENGKIVQKESLPAETEQKICAIYDYLTDYPDKLPSWLTDGGVKENFGFERPEYDVYVSTIRCSYRSDPLEKGLAISDYAYIQHVIWTESDFAKDKLTFTDANGVTHSFSRQAVCDYAHELFSKYGRGYHDEIPTEMRFLDETTGFVSNEIHFKYNVQTEELEDLYWEGYLFCKTSAGS